MVAGMRKYVIMGVQGSGKGTQAGMLAADLDLVHIGVGDIFRWHVQHHTKLGAQVRRLMSEGQLVGDDLVESTVRDRLAQHDWNYGFIVDGFPRSRRQAEFFLESYYHAKADPILELFSRKEFVVTVDARPDKQTVHRQIRDRLGLPALTDPA